MVGEARVEAVADEDRDKVPRGLPVGLWDWDVLSVSVKDTVSVSRGLREGEGVGEPEMGEKEGVREAGEAERLAVWVTVKESESSTVVEAVREGLVLRLCESVGDPEPVLVGVWVKLPVGEVLGVCVWRTTRRMQLAIQCPLVRRRGCSWRSWRASNPRTGFLSMTAYRWHCDCQSGAMRFG